MAITWRDALAGAAVLFLAFLVLKLRPRRRGRAALGKQLREARVRAHRASTPRDKAESLCAAAKLACEARRWRAVAGFYLRAMNADPTWSDPIDSAIQRLERTRPTLLKTMLWRRLANVPWDADHRAVLRAST